MIQSKNQGVTWVNLSRLIPVFSADNLSQPKSSRPEVIDEDKHIYQMLGLAESCCPWVYGPHGGLPIYFFFRKEVTPKSSNIGNIRHFVSEHQWFWVFHTILWNTHIIDISLVSSILLSMFGLWRRSPIQWGCVRFEKIDIQQHLGVSENSVPLHPMVNDHYP